MTAIAKVLLPLLVMFPALALAQVPRCTVLNAGIFRDVATYGSREAAVTPGGVEFLAYPGANYQVEVFNPVLARARKLVTSGKITAVG